MSEYINRAELISNLKEFANEQLTPLIETLIQKQPAADVVEVRRGSWIYDHWCEFRCSECGNLSKSEPHRGKEKFCPNCGAKMDGILNEH